MAGAITPATVEKVRALVTAFEAAPASRPGQPDWGHAEVLALLGEGLIERGDNVAARDAHRASVRHRARLPSRRASVDRAARPHRRSVTPMLRSFTLDIHLRAWVGPQPCPDSCNCSRAGKHRPLERSRQSSAHAGCPCASILAVESKSSCRRAPRPRPFSASSARIAHGSTDAWTDLSTVRRTAADRCRDDRAGRARAAAMRSSIRTDERVASLAATLSDGEALPRSPVRHTMSGRLPRRCGNWLFDWWGTRRRIAPVPARGWCGFAFSRLQIRRQRTRWGSCSASGHDQPECVRAVSARRVMRYLLIHELSHTRHMNHSRTVLGAGRSRQVRTSIVNPWVAWICVTSDCVSACRELFWTCSGLSRTDLLQTAWSVTRTKTNIGRSLRRTGSLGSG